jgi:hypothetical protein
MKKMILISVAAFVVSLGATTMLVVKRHPPAPPAATHSAPGADSAAKAPVADSSKKHPADSVAGDTTHHDTTSGHVSTGAPIAAAPAPTETAPSLMPVLPVGQPVPAPDKTKAFKEVARIFSSMKAAEAAKVLGFLSDTEVEGILRAVGPRQAADFMTNLPKERAAALSRRLLVPQPPKAEGAGQ